MSFLLELWASMARIGRRRRLGMLGIVTSGPFELHLEAVWGGSTRRPVQDFGAKLP